MKFKLFFLILTQVLLSNIAEAQQKQFEGWNTWIKDNECVAVLSPKNDGGTIKNITEKPYIAIKSSAKEDNFDGVAIVSGFGSNTGTDAFIEINGVEMQLLIFNGAGFVKSGEVENKLLNLMSNSHEAHVTWNSKDGFVTQTYILDGFQSAKKIIDESCPSPIKNEEKKPEEKKKKRRK